jgi:protein-disulfide isomerase
MHRTRRTFLAGGGSATAVALAGCLGGLGGGGGGGSDSLEDHPAGQALESQPSLGPPPGEADGVIVAFEDPSCTSCARYERQVLPEIRSDLVDPGHATFVFRGIPVIYPWGEPATHALEATVQRDEDAHWSLLAHYFGNQGSLSEGGKDAVLSATREFLAANTDVDADAVVTAVEDGSVDDAVETDLTAAEGSDVQGTPTILVFKDGQYQTKGTSLGVDVIRNTLGV